MFEGEYTFLTKVKNTYNSQEKMFVDPQSAESKSMAISYSKTGQNVFLEQRFGNYLKRVWVITSKKGQESLKMLEGEDFFLKS